MREGGKSSTFTLFVITGPSRPASECEPPGATRPGNPWRLFECTDSHHGSRQLGLARVAYFKYPSRQQPTWGVSQRRPLALLAGRCGPV